MFKAHRQAAVVQTVFFFIWRILFPCRAFLAFSVVAREAALHFASLLASARFSGGLEKIDGSSWIVVRRRLAVCKLFMVG